MAKLEPLVLPDYFLEHAEKVGWKEGEQYSREPTVFPYIYGGKQKSRRAQACRIVGRVPWRKVVIRFEDGYEMSVASHMIVFRG